MKKWTTRDIQSQNGKVAVVTGATGGIGFECALALATAGAQVLLVGRNPTKGKAALTKIRNSADTANARFELVDLASMKSIDEFTRRLLAENSPVDILINNAAVMSIPKRKTTEDGFELQFATNHLAHFALTAKMLPLLLKAEKPVVTTVSSLAHRRGKIRFDDLQGEKCYRPWRAYQQSKLANLLFAFELQRLSDQKGWKLKSNAAHPGYARTDIITNGPGSQSIFSVLSTSLIEPYFSHSAASGALPELYAAVAPEAEPAGYYGPSGFNEMNGSVGKAVVASAAQDKATAKQLWQVSERLLGMTFPVG